MIFLVCNASRSLICGPIGGQKACYPPGWGLVLNMADLYAFVSSKVGVLSISRACLT